MARWQRQPDPVVITGIGLTTSVGNDRESVWQAVREGRSAMRRLSGLAGIPDGMLIGAPVVTSTSAFDSCGITPDRIWTASDSLR